MQLLYIVWMIITLIIFFLLIVLGIKWFNILRHRRKEDDEVYKQKLIAYNLVKNPESFKSGSWERTGNTQPTRTIPVVDKYPVSRTASPSRYYDSRKVDEPDNSLMTGIIIGSMLNGGNGHSNSDVLSIPSPKVEIPTSHHVAETHYSVPESSYSAPANDNTPSYSPSVDNSSSYSSDFGSSPSSDSGSSGFSSD